MQDSKGKSHCSAKTMPVPSLVSCPNCGQEAELWSDEEETACPACGRKAFRSDFVLKKQGY